MEKYLTKEDLLKEIEEKKLTYGWIHTYDDISLKHLTEGKLKENKDKLNDLIEAKFFNTETELSVLMKEEGFSVVEFTPKGDPFIEEQQIIKGHKALEHKNPQEQKEKKELLIIHHYLGYDQDGQGYIKYTKLHDII
jgi:hypothetical protein